MLTLGETIPRKSCIAGSKLSEVFAVHVSSTEMNHPGENHQEKSNSTDPARLPDPPSNAPTSHRSSGNIFAISLKTSFALHQKGSPKETLHNQRKHNETSLKKANESSQQSQVKKAHSIKLSTPLETAQDNPPPAELTLPETAAIEDESESQSLQSENPCSPVSSVGSKSGKLIIMPAEPIFPMHPEDVHSVSSHGTHSSAASYRPSQLRPSLFGWNKRVSINTPRRRSSEHEVNWVEEEEPISSDSDETSTKSEASVRPSIVVNMDSIHGKRFSIALDRLDEDLKEY
ncbi:hypothetical protein FBUS_11658, partial [Fasciolopsis buskii]